MHGSVLSFEENRPTLQDPVVKTACYLDVVERWRRTCQRPPTLRN